MDAGPPARGRPEISCLLGDITTIAADAIVNAANESLAGGGGVDGAIHRAAGPGLTREAMALAPCPPGEARITGGHRLKARHVIHTVGPMWGGGDRGEAEVLASCYRNSLVLAEEHGDARVAFPAISTGIYGYPLEAATAVALQAVSDWKGDGIDLVRFVCFDQRTFDAYRSALA